MIYALAAFSQAVARVYTRLLPAIFQWKGGMCPATLIKSTCSPSPSFHPQVFCFPCILHYLGTSENSKWARCPICFDSVNEKQLKSVRWFTPPSHLDDEPNGARSQPSSSSASANVNPAETPKPGSSLR